ncbi:MAG: acetyl-CoA carboxylase biotin carboxyl carrier protein [Acidobacteria bacterium]|nr:MAG: acetyl-CoA carboxylase biotin carboxyl carrier protein [Acidobacteriota bacterium]REK03142.1 MAG: acetyl-CoA carboxylase biotin carboxyl carrier protein [Acidobacteriota bacterium]REK15402.1 MAG: acetyl-CoA carboxylase biotin carboxyl carrier protein [Acidobacteriota bacterium]REK42121.1 MAG: acetyl-CoA carboxylase biotin carboxyl carrier protein [Acidobacteriota bacterium]
MGTSKGKPANEPSLNMDELRELAKLVDEHGFTDFEFENKKIRVRLGKATIVHSAPAPPAANYEPAPPSPSAAPRADASPDASEQADEDDGLHKITSPIVGTFYRSPSPDKPAYVKEGDTVSADSVVCIVEAMKLMNEIQAEVAGEIVKVYVENAEPVEYGQPLFGIRK